MVTAETGKQHQQQLVRNQNLEDKVQRLKEVAKDCSIAEIESALKESYMDPDAAADKLLTQDPYIEVNRRRNKKKQNGSYDGSTEPRRQRENVAQGGKIYKPDRNIRNMRRGLYPRNTLSGLGDHRVEFRVKNDNRFHHPTEGTKLASAQGSALFNKRRMTIFQEKSSTGALNNQNRLAAHFISNNRNGSSSSHLEFSQSNSYNGSRKKESEKKSAVPISDPLLHTSKQNDPQSQSASTAVSNSVAAYPSASDPVHVPSPDSRSPAAIGTRKRDVGVVGGRWQSSENNFKQSSRPGSSKSSSVFGRTSTIVPSHAGNTSSKHEQLILTTASDAVAIGSAVSRAFLSHHGNRAHQQPASHAKGPVWKPKSSQKSNKSNPGVIGTPVKSALPVSESSRNIDADSTNLQDKLLDVNINEFQNVIIAEHIRVPENERYRVTFGSFDADPDSLARPDPGLHFQAVGNVETTKSSAGLVEEPSGSKQVNSFDEQARNSAPSSPSGKSPGQQLPDKRESSEASDIDKSAEVDLVHKDSPSYVASDLQQCEDPSVMQNFSAYGPQSGYDLYLRTSISDAVRGQGLPSVPEVLTSHTAASIPASSIAMMQQQPPPQMYPQVHVSPFPNVMPYRQFISPLYVPQMGLPGYSSSPAYPHPSNGSSYVLMSGGNSHLAANGLKYGVQQFKPVPAGAPTSFGGFASPTGYPVNAPGVVGGANGLDDSSRLKYKDNNVYVANPQAEASEVWIQNPRELPGMQSTQYFNMQGQTAHPAYLQSHTGHASFNPAVAAAANAQSSHMQFSGVYHNPQPGGFPNAHHLGGAMGGNVGIGVSPAAPGAQVGAYQPQQLGHLNWTTNF